MPLDPVTTAAISVGTSIVTTLVTTIVKGRYEKKQKDAEKKTAKLSDRLNRHKNVIRQSEEVSGRFGTRTRSFWYVNPFWVEFSDDGPLLREWPAFTLTEPQERVVGNLVQGYDNVPLKKETAQDARDRHEWLVFTEDSETLYYKRAEPCEAEEADLFQPLPEEKKGLLKSLSRKRQDISPAK